MTKPLPDGVAEIERLIALWELQMARPFTIRPDLHPANAALIWTFAHHAVRLSRAVLTLHGSGLDVEALPLMRQTLECAMNAAWLLVTEHGGVALSAVDDKNRRVMLREVTELGLADVTEALSRLEAAEAEGEREVFKTRSFEERCRALANGDWVYTVWRTLSLYSHASASVADLYLDQVEVSEGNPAGVAMLLNADWDGARSWLRIQAVMLLLAQIAADRAHLHPPHKTQLERAQRRLQVTFDIRLRDGA